MTNQPHVCIPQIIDPVDHDRATQIAVAENPQNRPGALEIAGIPTKFWRPGRVLRCRFMDGDPAVQARVATAAKVWSESANITFDFGDHADAEIRISFEHRGSWSTVGTDALLRSASQPTMNYGWLTPNSTDDSLNRVVLHEFGHALGMIHEHQHPDAGFEWDRDAVIEYYSGPPNEWDIDKIEFNVLDRANRDTTQFSAFDTKSIMLYPIPNEHTVGDFEVDWRNTELSEIDKAFIANAYPTDIAPFDAAVLAPNNKLYIFRGANYVRITPGGGMDAGYPKPIAGNWGNMPASFAQGIDAVMTFTDGKLYFFKGSELVRYTPGSGIDAGYPKPIWDEFPDMRF